jgi:enterochelin esterase-like enzyme
MKYWIPVLMLVLLANLAFADGTTTSYLFWSSSLEENRWISVYLPEGYDPDGDIDYPVICFLHGGYGNHLTHVGQLEYALDNLIGSGAIDPVILVAPDGSGGSWGGSFWANSELYGQYRDYVAIDVIAHIDSEYRTIADPGSRTLLGYSDGGDGASVIGLLHPDVFTAHASHSGFFNWDLVRGVLRDCVLQENSGPPYDYDPANGVCTEALFRVAGAYSPNSENPPYFVDLPLDENGDVDEEVLDRWKEYNGGTLAAALPPGDYPGIYFDCGTLDALNYQGNLDYAEALDDLGIPYEFYSFSGGHALNFDRLQHSITFLFNALDAATAVEYPDGAGGIGAVHRSSYPNPFNPSTTIRFELAEASSVRLQVVDLRGRVVESLIGGRMESGSHSVVWNGRDSAGREMPSGVYLSRLEVNGQVLHKSMTLVR